MKWDFYDAVANRDFKAGNASIVKDDSGVPARWQFGVSSFWELVQEIQAMVSKKMADGKIRTGRVLHRDLHLDRDFRFLKEALVKLGVEGWANPLDFALENLTGTMELGVVDCKTHRNKSVTLSYRRNPNV
jgi:hypothetical protein